MEKISLKNRLGLRLTVTVEPVTNAMGLVFVIPGLGGTRLRPHLQAIGDAFFENNISVVRFDVTNSFGESDGRYEDGTTTSYYHDLEDVIQWAAQQPWYRVPFYLTGHSLGGLGVALYAENYPKKVKALAPISPVVSGKLSLEARRQTDPEGLEHWQETGWDEQPRSTMPGLVKRLPWSHMEDRLRYDLLPHVSKLTMPVLLTVGELDTSTPADQVKLLYDALPGPKTFHVIAGAPHTFRDAAHLAELKNTISQWVKASLK